MAITYPTQQPGQTSIAAPSGGSYPANVPLTGVGGSPSTVVGDFLLAVFNLGTSTAQVTPPTGWAQHGSYISRNSGRLAVFYKFATSSEVGVTTFPFALTSDGVTPLTSGTHLCNISRRQGVKVSAPFPVTMVGGTQGSTTVTSTFLTATTPDITPVNADDLIVRIAHGHATPGSMTYAESGNGATGWQSGVTGRTLYATPGSRWIATGDQTPSGAGVAGGTKTETVAPATLATVTGQFWNTASLVLAAEPSGGTAPTVTSDAQIAAAHTPALVGDPVTVTVQTGYSASGLHPITLYGRFPQRSTDNGATWSDIAGEGGTNASQASLPVYNTTSSDDGFKVRYKSQAQNDVGTSAWSYSNALDVLNPPSVVDVPTITPSPPVTQGDTLTGHPAVFQSGGTVLEVQSAWQHDLGSGFVDTGNSDLTDIVDATEVGKQVRFGQRARNGSTGTGFSAWTYSNPLTISAPPPVSDSSAVWHYTGGTGNTDPALSLGGVIGGVIPAATVSAIFGPIPGSMAQTGGKLYAVVALKSVHPVLVANALKAFVLLQCAHAGLTIKIAVPDEAANTNVAVLASRTTPPAGRTFTAPADFASGLAFGDLGPGAFRDLYLELTVAAGTIATTAADSFTVRVRTETS